ncbi:MAG TPA: hypothetical protein VF423_11995 [Actinomycetes bacterium]
MGVRVRRIREDDEDAVLELIAEISRETPVVAGRIAAMVGTFGLLWLVAEADGVIVGRAALVRTPMMPPGTIAAGVDVRASSRGTGVGGALWDQLVGDLPAGTDRLLGFSDDRDDAEVPDLRALPPLHVASDNEAENAGMRRVNEKLGYVRTRGTRRFVRDLTANPLP